ncbi:MAG TPA: hypothetical protein VM934_02540 [Pyrinomonadaceae bacterium]|nr:hypothetical protein [Pyrinomonadaceae bacterium]
MSNTKCPRCGLAGWSGAEVCNGCGLPLDGGDTNACATESASPDFRGFTLGGDVPTGSRTWKLVLLVIFAVALCGAAWTLYKRSADSRAGGSTLEVMRKRFAPPSLDERTRDTVLSYLAQPGFAGTKVVEQVLGPVRLEMLQLPEREVYFSAPAPDQAGEAFEAMVARFVVDPKRVVVAEDDGAGRLRLGKYSLGRSADRHFFFKTPVDNIKFDPGTVLKFPFGPATYTLDMRELSDFLQNKSIFGGQMRARMEQRRAGLPVVFANHGAFVARPQETSLGRLVNELTRDIPADGEGARELRVQRVLDFVSREITYDLREATYNFELLKRPNEVLMSGQSDCSNKAILLGSLLEQLREDYLFVYTPDHITVAVRQGGFPAQNGLSLEWEGQTWLIAEGTVPGFRIGVDRVREEARLKQFQHVQRPRDRDVIFDIATGRRLLFQ